MRALNVLVLIFTIYKCEVIKGKYISTMLPMPKDLELLIDSMYNDGYSAEYLVKYDDITGDDIAQSDLMLGWERPMERKPAESQAIIDPDRDGAPRNLPAWMNYSKAVFVPNEIDYKIRARHRFHPHNGRIGGTLQKQIEHLHPEEGYPYSGPIATKEPISSINKATSSTSENLDFLLPIPEYGSTTKQHIRPSNKLQTTKKISVQNLASNSIMNSYIVPQNDGPPQGPSIFVTAQKSESTSAPSLFRLVDIFRKKFLSGKRENLTDNYGYTLESLYAKLTQMRDGKDKCLFPRKSEEEKQLSQIDESGFVNKKCQTKKHRASQPIITHTKLLHPGHKSSFLEHIRPPIVQHHIQRK